MNWSLALFVAVVAFFAYRGYRNGLLKSLARVSGVLAGYLCAIVFAAPAARMIESAFQLPAIVCFAAAALTLFVGAGVLVSLLFRLLAKLLAATNQPSTASSVGGAAVGVLTGLLLAVVIVWGYSFVRDLRSSETATAAAGAGQSKLEMLSNRIAGKVVETAMSQTSLSPEVTRLSGALIASPAEIMQRAERLTRSEALTSLFNEPSNQAVLDSGDVAAVRDLPAFRQLVNHPDLKALASTAGMTDATGDNAGSMESRLAAELTDVWGRAHAVKNDARVREILADADFQQKLQAGNPISLITDSRLLELAEIIFSVRAVNGEGATEPRGTVKPPTRVYSWTDSSGRVHFSDQEPEN